MNQTPEDPHAPDTGGGDAAIPARPPLAAGDSPPIGGGPDDGAISLPSLDDGPERRRVLTLGRLAAVTVVVLALVGGAAAFALSGDDKEPAEDGVASLDGSEGEVEGDGSSGRDDGGRPDESELQDAMLAYAECMREHGIDMPDPEFDENGGGIRMRAGGPDEGGEAEREKFEAAEEECRPLMDEVRRDMPKPSPEEQAEMRDKLVAMAECMRARGYDMPDPEVDENGGIGIRMGSGKDSAKDDEEIQKDQEECNAEAGLDDGPEAGPGKP